MRDTIALSLDSELIERIQSEAGRREQPVSWFAEKVLRKGLEIIDLETGKHPVQTTNVRGAK